tara:strand:+ start:78 stop:296 length:219 start_codon:yes stop_codon:yes gene_type:complete
MWKTLLKSKHIQGLAKLLPTLLGIDEYDVKYSEQNQCYINQNEAIISVIIITIMCFILYVSLNASLTIDEIL